MKKQIEYKQDGEVSTYSYELPSEVELLKDPELGEVIRDNKDRWLRQYGKILAKETIPYLKLVNTLCDGFKAAFWKEAYRYNAGWFNRCEKELTKFRRLEAMIDNPKSFKDWEVRKDVARQVHISDIFEPKKKQRTSKGYKCLCPIHSESYPSFNVYDDDSSFYCYGCNLGGDVFELVQKLKGINFVEAVNYLGGAN